MQSAIYYDTRIFKERVKTSWGRDSMLLKDLLGSRHHHRIYMNKPNNLKKRVSMPFRAYTKGWCYWKTYPNLRRQIGLKWENLFENGVSMPFRAYTKGWRYWKTYPNLRRQIGLIWWKSFENGVSMPFRAYTKGWCYWKTYPKPSTPNRT